MADITVSELKNRLDAGETPIMIDVREPYEWEAGALEGVEKISMTQLMAPEIQEQLKGYGDKEVIFICRSGNRSGQATMFAKGRLGLDNARNMEGGMLAWQANIDPDFQVG